MAQNLRHFKYLTDEAWQTYFEALQRGIDYAGGPTYFARLIGIDKNMPSHWRRKLRVPTMEQAISIEKHTGVPREHIRPDINWTNMSLDTRLNPASDAGKGSEEERRGIGRKGSESVA